jgi:flagella basal body P-ring formation protein FlgA
MRTLVLLALAPLLAGAHCVSVASDRILAGDLATAVPLFQALDPETPLGFAPFPGTVRILSSRDLRLLAGRHGLMQAPGEVVPATCVERTVHRLSHDEVEAALLSALSIRDAKMDVLDFSAQPVPAGRLQFQRATLSRPPAADPQTPVMWRGRYAYDEGRHSLAFWAKVRITVDRDVFVAAETISAGSVIRASQLKTVRMPCFPWPESASNFSFEIVGKIARRTIPAGLRISPESLDNPKDVIRGETVHVRVVNGATTISLDAVAQSSGSKGESIVVHNPSSGKNFRALVTDRGRVIVIPSAESRL